MLRFHDTDPERIVRRLEEIAEVERSRRRSVLRSVCGMVASIVISLLIMAWGFSMTDPDLGPTVFFGGALVGNVGIVLSLLWAAHADTD